MPDFFQVETTCPVRVNAEIQGKEDEWGEETEKRSFEAPKDLRVFFKSECPDSAECE